MRLIKTTYAPDQLRVVDDITGIDKKWIPRWRDAVLERDAVIPFECLTRVNLADDQLLGALKDMGCKKLYLGAESGSQSVLNAMNKGAKVEQIYTAAERCKQMGIAMYFFMMVGYPGEEYADLQKSARLLRTAMPEEFSTSIAYPLPGTPFYEQMRDRLMFESEWNLDWDYTAENKLLFKRERYSTFFYRIVIRWLNKEWEDAWLSSGKSVTVFGWLRIKGLLLGYRALVLLFAHLPSASTIRFQPAPGR
jgi:radical SAM superfamily enzyme YgiQ (UPF0313 family)